MLVKNESGMSLVEVMVTSAIVGGIALTMATMMSRMSKSNRTIRDQVSLIDLERRVQTIIADKEAVLKSALKANGLNSTTFIKPLVVDPGLNLCGQVAVEDSWSNHLPTWDALFENRNRKLLNCIAKDRQWDSAAMTTNGLTNNSGIPQDCWSGSVGCGSANAALNTYDPVTTNANALVNPGCTQPLTRPDALRKSALVQGQSSANDCTADVWTPFILYDRNGQLISGYYDLDGKKCPSFDGTTNSETACKSYPLYTQAWFKASCGKLGSATTTCTSAENIQITYSIEMSAQGKDYIASLKKMPFRARGVASIGSDSLPAISNGDGSPVANVPGASLANVAGGVGGTCQPETEVMTGTDSYGAPICKDKKEFLKQSATCEGSWGNWGSGQVNAWILDDQGVYHQEMLDMATIARKDLGWGKYSFVITDAQRGWVNYTRDANWASMIVGQVAKFNGYDDSGNPICEVEKPGISDCVQREKILSNVTYSWRCNVEWCFTLPPFLGGGTSCSPAGAIWQSGTSAGTSCPANNSFNRYTYVAGSQVTNYQPTGAFDNGNPGFDNATNYFDADIAIMTDIVCNADEIAVTGGGQCTPGSTMTVNSALKGYPRNWVMGCSGVTAIKNNTSSIQTKISANCCKNGKTNNAGRAPTGYNPFLYLSTHSRSDCTKAGGTVFMDGSDAACRFAGGGCPSGWIRFKEWSATTSHRQDCDGGWDTSCGVDSASHTFSNTPQSNDTRTCSYGCGAFSSCDTCTANSNMQSVGCY